MCCVLCCNCARILLGIWQYTLYFAVKEYLLECCLAVPFLTLTIWRLLCFQASRQAWGAEQRLLVDGTTFLLGADQHSVLFLLPVATVCVTKRRAGEASLTSSRCLPGCMRCNSTHTGLLPCAH